MIRRLLYRFCAWRAETWERLAGSHAKAAGLAFIRDDRDSMREFRLHTEECSARASRWWRQATRWYPHDLGDVHYSDWAQQPEVRIACDQSYGCPAWDNAGSAGTWLRGVYRRDDGRLYSFVADAITCERCREIADREVHRG